MPPRTRIGLFYLIQQFPATLVAGNAHYDAPAAGVLEVSAGTGGVQEEFARRVGLRVARELIQRFFGGRKARVILQGGVKI